MAVLKVRPAGVKRARSRVLGWPMAQMAAVAGAGGGSMARRAVSWHHPVSGCAVRQSARHLTAIKPGRSCGW